MTKQELSDKVKQLTNIQEERKQKLVFATPKAVGRCETFTHIYPRCGGYARKTITADRAEKGILRYYVLYGCNERECHYQCAKITVFGKE